MGKSLKGTRELLLVAGALFAGIVLILGFNFSGSYDSDFLWHTVLFDYIKEHRALPTLDVFSWRSVEMGYVETAHSWLGSICIGGTVRFFESIGMSIRMAGLMFTLFWYCVICLLIKKLFFKEHFDAFYFIVCVLMSCIMTHPRVHDMSYCIFILAYYFLIKTLKESKSNSYLAIPAMALLLANLHGGTIVLYLGFIVVFGICTMVPGFKIGVFEHTVSKDHDEKWLVSRKIMTAAVLSFVLSLINPYGLKLYAYFTHLNSDPFNTIYVSEWLPISVNNMVFMILFAVLLLPLVFNDRVNIIAYGAVLGFVILSFKHGRFINYGYLYSIPLIISYYNNYLEKKHYGIRKCTYDPDKRVEDISKKKVFFIYAGASALSIGVICLFLLGCRYVLNRSYVTNLSTGQPVEHMSLNDSLTNAVNSISTSSFMVLSDDAIDYLHERNYQRLFCSYDIGGPLIYSGFQSFIDSRADCFTGGELSDSAIILRQLDKNDNITAMLDAYNFDAMIFEADSYYACETYLQSTGTWVKDYEDDYVVVYRNLNYREN